MAYQSDEGHAAMRAINRGRGSGALSGRRSAETGATMVNATDSRKPLVVRGRAMQTGVRSWQGAVIGPALVALAGCAEPWAFQQVNPPITDADILNAFRAEGLRVKKYCQPGLKVDAPTETRNKYRYEQIKRIKGSSEEFDNFVQRVSDPTGQCTMEFTGGTYPAGSPGILPEGVMEGPYWDQPFVIPSILRATKKLCEARTDSAQSARECWANVHEQIEPRVLFVTWLVAPLKSAFNNEAVFMGQYAIFRGQ